ncbi:MAG: MFS transporter [Croceibacterium sp.]
MTAASMGEAAAPPAVSETDEGWSGLQLLVVGLCFVVNMIDGMDVLILSYIAPTLQKDLGVGADQIGVLFSAGLLGMAIGGLLIAPLADLFGRRRLILASFSVSTLAMILSGMVEGLEQLMVLRVFVGIGVGAVLASMAAIVAEYAPDRHRNFAVGLLYAGYPLGAIFTGFAAAVAIPAFGWQNVLTGAGLVSALVFPVLFFALPESLAFLTRQRGPGALDKVNRIRHRLGRPALDALPPIPATASRRGVAGLFSDGRAANTLLLWTSMISGFAALWFAISWTPQLATMAGLSTEDAIYAGTSFNGGAFVGTVVLGLITARLDLRRTILAFLVAAAAAMIAMGSLDLSVGATLALAFTMGFLLQGGFNGIYPLAARVYPAEVRSTGIGWTTGVGRAGAVAGPLLGGMLIERDVPLATIFLVFAIPAVIGGLCAAAVRMTPVARSPDQAAR